MVGDLINSNSEENDSGSEPAERTWKGPRERRRIDDPDADPFDLPPAPKDKVVVLHPEVLLHMKNMGSGRLNALKTGLTNKQVLLLKDDFLTALDFWAATHVCELKQMWQALEASRYLLQNSRYGVADVNEAVKLLISPEAAEDQTLRERQYYGVAAVGPQESGDASLCKFRLIPAPGRSPAISKTGSPAPPSAQARTPGIKFTVVTNIDEHDGSKATAFVVRNPTPNPNPQSSAGTP